MIRNMHIHLKEHTGDWCRPLLKRTSSRLPQGVHLAIAFGAALFLTFSGARAQATNYYVSPSGNNTTGLSYATAWNELDQINWSGLTSSDMIYIDGGPSGLTYGTPLTIPANITAPGISPSADTGHSGPITIDGSKSTSGVGITINSDVRLFYLNFQNLVKVQNWKTAGVQVNQITNSVQLDNLEVCFNPIGVHCLPASSSSSLLIYGSVAHDNQSVNIRCNGVDFLLQSSWIYNSYYPKAGQTIKGVHCFNNGSANFTQCVIGPGLTYGVLLESPERSLGGRMQSCLLIDATKANIACYPSSSGSTTFPYLINNCTSFMTPLNPTGRSHNCLTVTLNPGINPWTGTENFQTMGSIFYGGNVNVPASLGQLYSGNQNYQYQVSGNTTALAPFQADPQFITDVYAYPNNVSITTLANTDFSARVPAGPLPLSTSAKQLFPNLFPWSPPPAPKN
jgi:hypothetical protein